MSEDAPSTDAAGAPRPTAHAPVLAAGRTTLAPLRPDDAPLWIALYTDPVAMAHVGPPLSTAAAMRSFATALRRQDEPHARRRFWVQRIAATGEAVGLHGVRHDGGDAELGVMILPAHHRAGHAAAGLAALLAHVSAMPGRPRATARHPAGHAAMASVLRRLGFACTHAGPEGCVWAWTGDNAARVPLG